MSSQHFPLRKKNMTERRLKPITTEQIWTTVQKYKKKYIYKIYPNGGIIYNDQILVTRCTLGWICI